MKRATILGLVLCLFFVAIAVAQQSAPTATPAPSEAEATPAPAPSLTIARMEIAANVTDRKPVDVGTTFPESQEKVFCFLEFKDVKNETTVSVVWSVGQKELAKIPLTIKPFAKFRTWANKSIYGMKGDWKVDVLDEKGVLLKSASFTVQ